MNRNHASPEDSGQRADDTVDAHLLAEIEQQLKKVQPRPPELDIDEIVRSASEANQSVVLAQPLDRQDGNHSYHGISMIAGSWVCGAMAGALVTFMLLGRSVPQEVSPDTIVTVLGEDDVSNDEDEPTGRDDSPKNVPAWSRSESLVSVMLLHPYNREPAPYGVASPTLRAGNFARREGTSGSLQSRLLTGPLTQNGAETPDPTGDVRRGVAPDSAPAPSITREWLLRELLDPNPGKVL